MHPLQSLLSPFLILITTINTTTATPLSPSANNETTTCPPAHPQKNCCTSIDSIGDGVTSQLGDLIPYIKGVEISSIVGVDCQEMAASDPNSNCGLDVMCCSGSEGSKTTTTNTQTGKQTLLKAGCIPYEQAIREAENEEVVIGKSQGSAQTTTSSSPSKAAESLGPSATPI